MTRLTHLALILLLLTACVRTGLVPAPTSTPQTLNLHIQITGDQNPIPATIWLYWPDTDEDLAIGPTSDNVLPIPADGAPISVTVTALGCLIWSRVLTPTESLSLVVRLGQKPETSDL